MNREFTCIICPNGCRIKVEYEKDGDNTAISSIDGNLCDKGAAYVEQELIMPMRTIASSVAVEGGILPLASVRLTKPVPKERINDVMKEIRKVRVKAPVREGTVLISDILGLSSDVIATKNVESAVPSGSL